MLLGILIYIVLTAINVKAIMWIKDGDIDGGDLFISIFPVIGTLVLCFVLFLATLEMIAKGISR